MENMTYVMMNTSHTYEDIMKMPIVAFLSILKNIQKHELMQNPEWRKKYMEYQIKEKYEQSNTVKNTDLDINALKSFMSSL